MAIIPTMFLALLVISQLTLSDASVPEPGAALERPYSPYFDGTKSDGENSRWSGSLGQFGWGWLGGAAGSALGAAGGAILGRGIGWLVFGNRKEPDKVEPIYRIQSAESAQNFGIVVGVVVGDGLGTGLAVHSQAGDRYTYPSQGPWLPALGAGVLMTAGLVYAASMPDNPSDAQSVFASVLVLIAPQVVAVVTDRWTAPGQAQISVAPWFPGHGQQGLVMTSRF